MAEEPPGPGPDIVATVMFTTLLVGGGLLVLYFALTGGAEGTPFNKTQFIIGGVILLLVGVFFYVSRRTRD